MGVKASPTGGVKPMSIAGRYMSERERLAGMTPEERMFRKQWLKDQELAPNEPRFVPEMYKARYNPIRRFYRWPLDTFAKAIEPIVGTQRAHSIRYFTGKAFLFITGAYLIAYYAKYNSNDWTRKGGWRAVKSRVSVVEGDPGYPKVSDRKVGTDYASRGFKDVTLKL